MHWCLRWPLPAETACHSQSTSACASPRICVFWNKKPFIRHARCFPPIPSYYQTGNAWSAGKMTKRYRQLYADIWSNSLATSKLWILVNGARLLNESRIHKIISHDSVVSYFIFVWWGKCCISFIIYMLSFCLQSCCRCCQKSKKHVNVWFHGFRVTSYSSHHCILAWLMG